MKGLEIAGKQQCCVCRGGVKNVAHCLCITGYLYEKEIFLTEPLEEESFENSLITVIVDK